MNWKQLEKPEQLQELFNESSNQNLVIFKHSTRCNISKMVKDRIERDWKDTIDLPFYYLDLINNREISNSIAEQTGVEHQSPQIIVLRGGKSVFTTSHGQISLKTILESITS